MSGTKQQIQEAQRTDEDHVKRGKKTPARHIMFK